MFGGLFELATLSLALTTVVGLSGGPETLASGRMELTCGQFFRGGNKLLKGGEVTTADDLSLLTCDMRSLDCYQLQASARTRSGWPPSGRKTERRWP